MLDVDGESTAGTIVRILILLQAGIEDPDAEAQDQPDRKEED